MISEAAPKILAKVIAAADQGNDPVAQKTFMSHVWTPPKLIDPPIADFPHVKTAKEATEEIARITQRAARGELKTDHAHFLVDKLKTFIVGYAAVELEAEVFKAKLRDMSGEEP
jgi:hypothetical protein